MSKTTPKQNQAIVKLPAILGCPFDGHSTFMRGAAAAPDGIREALRCDSTNRWSESGFDLGETGRLIDAGDVRLLPDEDDISAVERGVKELLGRDLCPISLGGDHAVTYPIIRAFAQFYQPLDILVFDAHPDLYDHYKEDRLTHASPFARIGEAGLATRLVQVGIRTVNDHQREQAERFGVEMLEMKNWRDDGPLRFSNPLYISFDMDALDPAFAPGVSHHEPGGFSTREAVGIIQKLQAPAVVGGDVVEYNPRRDSNGVTAMAAAKILKEIAAKILAGSGSLRG